KHHARRHLYDRIPRRRGQPRRAEDEVVSVDQVRRPGRVVGGRDDGIQVELCERGVDAVDARVVVDRQRLVVRDGILAIAQRLRRVWIGVQRVRQIEDVLVEERHLEVGVGIVEVDRRLQVFTRYGNTSTRGEVRLHV